MLRPVETGGPEGRLLPWDRVRDVTGLSRSTAWRPQQVGDCPEPVLISPNRAPAAPPRRGKRQASAGPIDFGFRRDGPKVQRACKAPCIPRSRRRTGSRYSYKRA